MTRHKYPATTPGPDPRLRYPSPLIFHSPYTEEAVQARLKQLGGQSSEDYRRNNLRVQDELLKALADGLSAWLSKHGASIAGAPPPNSTFAGTDGHFCAVTLQDGFSLEACWILPSGTPADQLWSNNVFVAGGSVSAVSPSAVIAAPADWEAARYARDDSRCAAFTTHPRWSDLPIVLGDFSSKA